MFVTLNAHVNIMSHLIDIPCFNPIQGPGVHSIVWQGGAEGNVTYTLGQALTEEGFTEVNA